MQPVEVYCLAEFLCDKMQERGWTTQDVARRMGGSNPVKTLSTVELVLASQNDKLIIDDDTFAGLARAFGFNETLLRNLDESWRAWPDRRVRFTPPDSII